MKYRRFGKTELRMPVLTCGGMRYQQSWQDIKPEDLERKVQDNVDAIVRHAVENGINHVETARGYGSSEHHLGLVLPQLPREDILVQTKIGPTQSESEFLSTFETSMNKLKVDYLDLLSIHGINSSEKLDTTLRKGSHRACRRLQDEGVVRHVGFSTHADLEVILAAINTGEFSYVNLHWYYFDQRNWPAVTAANERDMGVFIISPTDKGGQLFKPPKKLRRLCDPLTPIGFNDLFCLSHDQVHTLSIGAAAPTDFGDHLDIVDLLDNADATLAPIQKGLQDEFACALGQDWADHWHDGVPFSVDIGVSLPLYQVLRLYSLAKAFDMVDYGKYRYNLLNSGGDWFPGNKIDEANVDHLQQAMPRYRFIEQLPEILRETHEMLNQADTKRLSES